ncbi:hypothetical protein N657DRAFT_657768 [Parathielavia appendiculata]|uniref:Uncharacterized protein n=1 Tax=Parathielavia appendiculata TaxID=2587402 RepID=A0AAN6TV09_9PEZI|nr:hypothetical protein N657DRAFT_657768 [Parathielavia appendiculata]
MAFPPVESRKDAIVVLRRDSASSRSSSHNSSATPTHSSPRPTPTRDLTSGHNLHSEPFTPSSTIVEFGDLGRGHVPSAAQLVESVARSFSQSRVGASESRSNSKARLGQDNRDGREGRESRDQSRSRSVATPTAPRESRDRSQSTQRRSSNAKDARGTATDRNATSDRGLAEERINRFLQSMAQQAAQSSESELLQENKSLYQRIAALQRTERELLAENQDLTRKLAALKQHHERRARQWNEGIRRKETEYEARMRELGKQLLDLVSKNPQKLPGILSDEEISAWFDEQDGAWNKWATTFGHQDANRLADGLHPLQLQELCGDVKAFVRMTESGTLPPEIVGGGKEALHTLLNGMLANFICDEIIASPMWVFVAASLGTLESPGIFPAKALPSLPGVGFRMDMNSFSEVAPLRPGNPVQTPRSPQFPPPLITSMMPALGSGASFLGLPLKPDMERLVRMLTDAQDEDTRDVADAGRNESRRSFVESRLNYARKLKERFLGGSARFLLQDQDASGIERLERMLSDMIDDALRFSCRLWTRVAPHRLHGWKDLGSKEVRAATPLVTLCHAQVEVESRTHRSGTPKDKPSGSPQESQTEQPIVMVVQPAVVTDSISLPGINVSNDGVALVWLRARVMLAGPMAVEVGESSPAGVGTQTSPRPDNEPSPAALNISGSGTSSAPVPGTPKAFEMLPASSFKPSGDAPS